MYYVLFVGSVPADKSALSGQYYGTLQPFVHSIKGFIEETSFGHPSRSDERLLLARFTDEDALKRWRNHPQHLKVMRHSRSEIFQWYRITVGTDASESPLTTERSGRVVIMYQRPAVKESHVEHMQLPLRDARLTSNLAEDPDVFVGESLILWIFRLNIGVVVDEFKATIDRVPGDAVVSVHVVREYTQSYRSEAPAGLDEAELRTEAGNAAPLGT